ncbi:MAG: ferrous iron transport protein B [bacterium]|nr:ferrous iron transport protein B [bacterium]
MIFALVGNQNSGKTTLFNTLTGANQRVGNFPGVTVDSKTGEIRRHKDCTVVDLPGIYSIRPYSAEEIVTRDFVLEQNPDAIINIVDATNIERNLYLTLQLIELKIPMVVALNMMDEVRGNGGTVDVAKISEMLGVPVVPISASKNEGISELINTLISTAKSKRLPSVYDFCAPGPVHRCIHAVSHLIEDHAQQRGISARFAAIKLIEGDLDFSDKLNLSENELHTIGHNVQEMESECKMDANAALADMRYSFIETVCLAAVVKCSESREHKRSVKIDSLLTNKYLALPIFFSILILIFWLTFSVLGSFLSDLLLQGIETLTLFVDTGLKNYGINPVIGNFIVNGIFVGVGSVVSFLPLIIVLFLFLSILEDTGYMARVAFVMDKILRKIGLSGRSFVPMIIGFGCSVPAIMATRTLSSERDRKLTVLLTPFMSCSAKIPIYAVFCAAFFPKHATLVISGLYIFGVVVGILVALLLNKTVFRGKPVPFVMEMPNYRMPSIKSVMLLLWEKAKDFLQKAFTVIFVATIIIWFLGSFDAKLNFVDNQSNSLLASVGKLLSPIFAPLGLGDWKVTTSLISGLSAKEAVISTMSVLAGTTLDKLDGVLATMFTPISAISFLVFTLLYTPCVAAIAAFRRELNSLSKTLLIIILQCSVAWICAFAVYRLCHLLVSLNTTLNIFDLLILAAVLVCVVLAVTYIIKQKKKGRCVGCGSCEGCLSPCQNKKK